jgi:hypothetical protein
MTVVVLVDLVGYLTLRDGRMITKLEWYLHNYVKMVKAGVKWRKQEI